MKNLGKHRLYVKSYLTIKSIDYIDIKILQALAKLSVSDMSKRYRTEK